MAFFFLVQISFSLVISFLVVFFVSISASCSTCFGLFFLYVSLFGLILGDHHI